MLAASFIHGIFWLKPATQFFEIPRKRLAHNQTTSQRSLMDIKAEEISCWFLFWESQYSLTVYHTKEEYIYKKD